MIWQNPWAWLGLGTLALPVLIHLLGRGRARVLRFPSLRFVEATRPKALRRTRIHDPLLLIVRLAILAVAVMALAEPLVQTRARRQASTDLEARAVILDTSESVRRSGGGLDSVRALARRTAAAVRTSVLVETDAPRTVLDGVVQWLARQPGKRSLVIISDFQVGTVDSADVARVSRDVGIDLVRLATATRNDSVAIALRGRSGAGDVDVRATMANASTDVEWRRDDRTSTGTNHVELLAGTNDLPIVETMRHAALDGSVATGLDTTRRVAIVFPSFAQRAALPSTRAALTNWMADVAMHLTVDSTLIVAAQSDSAVVAAPTGVAIARDVHGAPSVVAARDGERLVLFENANAASVTSLALIGAVARATSLGPVAGELDPARIPDATLASWRRAAAPAPPDRAATAQDASDGRWLWMIVLSLLAIETWIRRERRIARDAEDTRELAA